MIHPTVELLSFDPSIDLPAELAVRAAISPGSGCTTRHIVQVDGEPAAFVALDWLDSTLVLYELWVRSDRRGSGIAMIAIEKIVAVATENGLASVTVRPSPIDPATSADRLRGLYWKAGFRPDAADPELFVRQIGE